VYHSSAIGAFSQNQPIRNSSVVLVHSGKMALFPVSSLPKVAPLYLIDIFIRDLSEDCPPPRLHSSYGTLEHQALHKKLNQFLNVNYLLLFSLGC